MDVDESRGMVSETGNEWSKGDVMRLGIDGWISGTRSRIGVSEAVVARRSMKRTDGFELLLSDLVLWIEWISGPDSLPGRQIYSWPWW
jgi:hypothetical protein